MTVNDFNEIMRSRFDGKPDGQYRETCPACSYRRKPIHQREKVLSINVEWPDVRWNCHHCGEKGGINIRPKESKVVKFVPTKVVSLSNQASDYLKERGLSEDTIASGRVMSAKKYIPKAGREILCAGFPYIEPGADSVYAVKFRGIEEKGFVSEGAAHTFYGIERVKIGEPIVISEGEIDSLSIREAGIMNSVSVPNGAPIKVSDGVADPSEDKKFSYVWYANEILKETKKIIIAVDTDGPGGALAEELARRIGKPKCWSVEWPPDCKDANDTLTKHGKAAVANAINEATPWPIAGLYDVEHYSDAVRSLYWNGAGKGLSTGYGNVDDLMTIKTGLVYICTGVPSMGKSEFVDQLLFNLSRQYDWKHCVCSFENPPPMHIAKLLEKVLSRPFYDGPTPRMTEAEMERALAWVDSHFLFMEQSDGLSATIDTVLERATAAVARNGSRSLVIDPFSYLDLGLGSKSETNLISEMLTKVRNWAAAHDAVVFFVAHPAKMYRDKTGDYPIPKGWDISASSQWAAKGDVGFTVHQNSATGMVEIHVWKVRFKHIGQQGIAELSYDKSTGTYEEAAQENWEETLRDF